MINFCCSARVSEIFFFFFLLHLVLDSNVRKWTVGDVAMWLGQVNLSNCREAFWREEIDGDVLIELDESSLKEMGFLFGRRSRLLREVCKLKEGAKELGDACLFTFCLGVGVKSCHCFCSSFSCLQRCCETLQ